MRTAKTKRMKLFAILALSILVGAVAAVQLSNYLMFGVTVHDPYYTLALVDPFPATMTTLMEPQAALNATCQTPGETIYLHIQSDDALGDCSHIYFQFNNTAWTNLDATGRVSFTLAFAAGMDAMNFTLGLRITQSGTYSFTAWVDSGGS